MLRGYQTVMESPGFKGSLLYNWPQLRSVGDPIMRASVAEHAHDKHVALITSGVGGGPVGVRRNREDKAGTRRRRRSSVSAQPFEVQHLSLNRACVAEQINYLDL